MAVICLNCEGWGCAQCKLERQAAAGGEQGPTAEDLELIALRHERDTFKGLADDLTRFLGERVMELEKRLADVTQERDAARDEAISALREASLCLDAAEFARDVAMEIKKQRDHESFKLDEVSAHLPNYAMRVAAAAIDWFEGEGAFAQLSQVARLGLEITVKAVTS